MYRWCNNKATCLKVLDVQLLNMDKQNSPRLVGSIIGVLAGSLAVMVLTIIVYGLTYNLLERLFYPGDPLSFPAGLFRSLFTVLLLMLYLLLRRTRLSEIVKAILMTGPLAAVIITVGYVFYERLVVSVIFMLLAVCVCGLLLFFARKPWFYYYAAALAVLVGVAYAWPRPTPF